MGNYVVVAGRGETGYVADMVRAVGVEYYGIAMKGIKDIIFLRRLVKKYNIDIIHTTLDRADHFGVLISRLTRTPVVSTMNVPRYHIGYTFADRVIVVSNKLKAVLHTRGVKSAKISVVRPGVDPERFENPDIGKKNVWHQRLAIDDYSIVFCHISSLIPRKAHMLSLELVAECKRRGENPLLIIIGDPLHGEYYDSLTKKISSSGTERNVYFTGWTSEIPELLSLSDFTLLPSENEALGIALMEGMAAGTPIIARAGEGGAELIEEYKTGFLYKSDEGIGALADKIITLRCDAAQYNLLSDRCRKIARNEFSDTRFGERLIELYRSVIA